MTAIQSQTVTFSHTDQTHIKRDGQRITLTIDRYQGRNVLAYDEQGRPWVKVGRGPWTLAYITVP